MTGSTIFFVLDARPVFYVDALGFTLHYPHEEDGHALALASAAKTARSC